jgi:hypothetical protein
VTVSARTNILGLGTLLVMTVSREFKEFRETATEARTRAEMRRQDLAEMRDQLDRAARFIDKAERALKAATQDPK